jgi:hypothetical protein
LRVPVFSDELGAEPPLMAGCGAYRAFAAIYPPIKRNDPVRFRPPSVGLRCVRALGREDKRSQDVPLDTCPRFALTLIWQLDTVGGQTKHDHRLDLVPDSNAGTRRLVAGAAMAAGIDPVTVRTVMIIAARFARLAWKYESIACSLLLKNVGVVIGTTYLAATAMGLAVCALGVGDADLFVRTAGCDYYERTSVGELLLGSAPRGRFKID